MARRSRVTAVACLLAVTATGCLGHQPPTLEELRKVPEASLHPPGASLVREGGSDSDDKLGSNAAVLVDVYATDETAGDVLGYYRDQLGSAWTEDDNAGTRATQWAQSAAWVSDDYVLQVGMDDASYRHRFGRAYPDAADASTLFEIQLQARPQ
jgi:hypothetical protein